MSDLAFLSIDLACLVKLVVFPACVRSRSIDSSFRFFPALPPCGGPWLCLGGGSRLGGGARWRCWATRWSLATWRDRGAWTGLAVPRGGPVPARPNRLIAARSRGGGVCALLDSLRRSIWAPRHRRVGVATFLLAVAGGYAWQCQHKPGSLVPRVAAFVPAPDHGSEVAGRCPVCHPP